MQETTSALDLSMYASYFVLFLKLFGVREHGLYFTTCAPAQWYASGPCGLFVALFVCSKLAELVDMVLLLLVGKPVLALQWWHHSAVRLYGGTPTACASRRACGSPA